MAYDITSLKDVCVDTLVEDFDKVLIFLGNERNVVSKEFLQENFSDILFYKVERPLQKKHAEFFINKHIKDLDMGAFSLTAINTAIETLKKEGEEISILKFMEPEGVKHSEECFVKLAGSLPSKLNYLYIKGGACSDKVLKIIVETCQSLETLLLDDCSVTDDGLRDSFMDADQPINAALKEFYLGNASVTVEGLRVVLNSCPNLNKLHHPNLGDLLVDINRHHIENNISPIREYNLNFLCLAGLHLQATQALCPNAEHLIVYGIKTQDQIDTCRNFQKLKVVVFHGSPIISLSSFLEARGSDLTKISVSRMTISVESLIRFCPNIECLTLYHPKFEMGEQITLDGAQFLLPNLKTLKIGDVNLVTEIPYIRALFVHSPNIEKIKFRRISYLINEFVDTMKAHHLPCVNYISIHSSDQHRFFIARLCSEIPSLRHIVMKDCIEFTEEEDRYYGEGTLVRVTYKTD